MTNIETLNTENPTEFWNHVNKLGPKIDKAIPMEVYGENNTVSYDLNDVLRKWKNDYEGLYNLSNIDIDSDFDDSFYAQAINMKIQLENMYNENNASITACLNEDISLEEVTRVVNHSKRNKAVGPDKIPYEILKNDRAIHILFQFFHLCFNLGKVPSMWGTAIIKPIPKSALSDPRVPLNYRGISLLSNVSKLYSGILNNRLSDYLDSENI